MIGKLALAVFGAIASAAGLLARGLRRGLILATRALPNIARYLSRLLWWAGRIGVPALGRGARGVGRFAWPRLVVAVALLGYGATRTGTWIRRKISRANESP